jgi:hypothetical protein
MENEKLLPLLVVGGCSNREEVTQVVEDALDRPKQTEI